MMIVLEDVKDYVNLITAVIFPLLSLIGNSLCIIIFLREKLRNQAMNRYSIVIALSDTVEVFTTFMYIITSILDDFSDVYCKIAYLLSMTFFPFCTFLRGVVSVDRLLTVKYPKRFQLKNSGKLQFLVVIIAACLSTLLSYNYYLFYGRIASTDNSTLFSCKLSNMQDGFYLNVSLFVFSIIAPYCLMSYCTLAVWKLLRDSARRLKKLNCCLNNRKDQRTLKTMIGLDLFFVMFYGPCAIYYIIISINKKYQDGFIYNLISVYSITHNTFPFVAYLFCNKIFLREAKNVFCSPRQPVITDTSNFTSNTKKPAEAKTPIPETKLEINQFQFTNIDGKNS